MNRRLETQASRQRGQEAVVDSLDEGRPGATRPSQISERSQSK
jgi:hypothetical protein